MINKSWVHFFFFFLLLLSLTFSNFTKTNVFCKETICRWKRASSSPYSLDSCTYIQHSLLIFHIYILSFIGFSRRQLCCRCQGHEVWVGQISLSNTKWRRAQGKHSIWIDEMPSSEEMVYSSLSTVFFSRDGWLLYSFYSLFGRKV
jgi:hypothetical protein